MDESADFTAEELAEEEWRPVPGFPGYEVSDLGRVRGSRCSGRYAGRAKRRPKLLKPIVHRTGYVRVLLYRDDGNRKQCLVHRLVLDAFAGLGTGLQACHNDGVRSNNRLSNLRWDTCAANCADKIRHGTHTYGESHGMAILTEAGVRLMRWLYVEHDVPQRLLAEWFGVGVAAAGYAATGFTWKHVPMYAPQSESP